MGEKITILFNLTGVPAVRKDLHEKLMAADNRHAIIATETNRLTDLVADCQQRFLAERAHKKRLLNQHWTNWIGYLQIGFDTHILKERP